MLLLIPLSVALEHFHASPTVVFVTASLAIMPLAEWMRHARSKCPQEPDQRLAAC